jgi:DNA polymerase-3 subunit delta'
MILGHERQRAYLNRVLQKGRLAHAYLFCGPEGVGKFTIARTIAKRLYCTAQPQVLEEVCNECKECRRIDGHEHPSVVILDREHTLVSAKVERQEIPLEDIRELRRRLSFAPDPREWRVTIINEAERMSEEAANAFLKLLEEPGARVLFILIAVSRGSVFPTIASRTQVINFSLVPQPILEQFARLRAGDPQNVRDLLWLADGRPGVLKKCLEDGEYCSWRRTLHRQLEALAQKPELPRIFLFSQEAASSAASHEETIHAVFEQMRVRLRQNPPTGSITNEIARIRKVSAVSDALQTSNVNPRLALEVLLIEALIQ